MNELLQKVKDQYVLFLQSADAEKLAQAAIGAKGIWLWNLDESTGQAAFCFEPPTIFEDRTWQQAYPDDQLEKVCITHGAPECDGLYNQAFVAYDYDENLWHRLLPEVSHRFLDECICDATRAVSIALTERQSQLEEWQQREEIEELEA